MKIKSDKEFRDYQNNLEILIAKGTALGGMDYLSAEDKAELVELSDAIAEWEAAYYPLPCRVSSLLTDEIRARMEEMGINQKQAAKLLGISESRVSDLLSGKRALNLKVAVKLRDNLGIPADFIFDCV